MGVYTEIFSNDVDVFALKNIKGIILSGGPHSVYDEESPQVHASLWKVEIPILGLCYGHQLMAHNLWGIVETWTTKEYGTAVLSTDEHILFENLAGEEKIWMSHGDEITKLPEWFVSIGQTSDCNNAAIANDVAKKYGFQFHPEVIHTPNGIKMLENFVFEVCKVPKQRNRHNYTEQILEEIKTKTGDNNVFMLVSGWVDSTVAFTLLNKSLGEKKCYGLFIDNGLMRHEEGVFVKNTIQKLWYNNFHTYDASEYFLDKLEGVSNPEVKRKIIWEAFIYIQQKVVKELNFDPDKWLLGQGTIYPDIIESQGTKHASLIKTHHNRIPLIQKMLEQWKVIEPLMNLYKDEVREVGLEIGLPRKLVFRHPFPWPGLWIRILCNWEVSDEGQIKRKNVFENIEFSILPIKSVGAQGDARTYRHPALLEGDWERDELEKISTTLTNNLNEINRCLLLLGTKKSIEEMQLQERKYLSKERLNLLRKIDWEVENILKTHNVWSEIWQMPVVLVPFGNKWETIILRPVNSNEAMTATFVHLEKNIMKEVADKILSFAEIDAVMYDVTNKPPGTIEWE